jgi:hypothetical protein
MLRTSALGVCLVLTGCLGTLEAGPAGPVGTSRRPVDPPVVCDPGAARPDGATLRRLTPAEHRNTLRDLFPGVALPEVTLAADSVVGGFDNQADGQSVSSLLTEQYHRAAGDVARAASASLETWAPCTTDDAACAARIAETLATRAQRHALDAEERTLYVDFVETARAELGLTEAVSMLIEALLQSPRFLYRPELGDGAVTAPEGLVALDGFEVASRLSYFLWRTMPDPALFDAAAAGELATPEGLEAHARRMLDDPRAHETIADLHAQWFQLRAIDDVALDPAIFAGWDEAMRADLRASAERFLGDAFWEEGSIDALFTGSFGYVNDRLAPVLGVPPPGSDELVRVELDPSQRAGILTQPGWLAYHAKPSVHSPIFRGVFVLEHVLCSPTPPAPPGADAMSEPLPPDLVVTTRERTERSHTGRCASCHQRIDGAGFLFEHYDALGRFRETEFDLPIDASGLVLGAGDADGELDGAIELAERLGQSRQVRECVSRHYLRYALGRSTAGAGDRCQIAELADHLDATTGDPRELVVAIATSPSFRYRPEGSAP